MNQLHISQNDTERLTYPTPFSLLQATTRNFIVATANAETSTTCPGGGFCRLYSMEQNMTIRKNKYVNSVPGT